MKILGISSFYHDSAAALIVDGEIISAAQEERFTRVKHDSSFPSNAIRYCLESHNLKDIDFIAFYEKPFLKFERLLETYLAFAPKGFASFQKAIPLWIKDKLFQKNAIINYFKEIAPGVCIKDKLLFSDHHLSHVASAFYPSPFEEAAILVLDGVGEWTTTSLAVGSNSNLSILKEIHFPHSLGLLYSAFTYYTGFKVNSGEYKVMGLAPYGEPKYAQLILDNLIDVKQDGSFRLNMSYFDYATGLTMTNTKFDSLFGGPPRSPESSVTQKEMDLAASIQVVLEQVLLKLTESIAKETKQKNLCLAGGVALNCVANGKILKSKHFENIWIQPAAGDAGGSIGAALAAYHLFNKKPRNIREKFDGMQGAYLGPSFSNQEISERLTAIGARFIEFKNEDDMIKKTAEVLAAEKAIGWFQGKSEFGPRSLGNRSILADPRCTHMQKTLNLKVKYRESFRPFAPSVLMEDLEEWFSLNTSSPYMLLVSDIADQKKIKLTNEQDNLFGIEKLNSLRSHIPAVTHVDYSARIQTVHEETNPAYYKLLKEFKRITGCPVLVNTSFNVRGEPIVNTPEDAFRCFMSTELDFLVVGLCVLDKTQQNVDLKINYKDQFELD